ncbi:DUF5462 family protein [Shewanella waksmanii]|uniref:DUF5462 family protein n=1 Tax=Shewanella waksmanii TaxID=213783 RepID=UPI0012F95301|nr:DUF5462 family protein [Shewanella waksmanii]
MKFCERLLVMLVSLVLSFSVNAELVKSISNTVSLGVLTVSDSVSSSEVVIKKSVDDSSLLSITRADSSKIARRINIKNAKVIGRVGNDLLIEYRQLGSSNINSVIVMISLSIDGRDVGIDAIEQGIDLVLFVPKYQHRLDLLTKGDLKINFKKGFKGHFKFDFALEVTT